MLASHTTVPQLVHVRSSFLLLHHGILQIVQALGFLRPTQSSWRWPGQTLGCRRNLGSESGMQGLSQLSSSRTHCLSITNKNIIFKSNQVGCKTEENLGRGREKEAGGVKRHYRSPCHLPIKVKDTLEKDGLN